MTIDELDALTATDAESVLRACCGSSRWVSEMASRRPFGTLDALLGAADETWSRTGPADWLEAFSHHPRIGQSAGAATQSARAAAWSAGEQAAANHGHSEVQQRLSEMNRRYEDRFGHIYIICATGRTAAEMLRIAEERLGNDPDTELRIAAEEQRKITELRLRKLIGDPT